MIVFDTLKRRFEATEELIEVILELGLGLILVGLRLGLAMPMLIFDGTLVGLATGIFGDEGDILGDVAGCFEGDVVAATVGVIVVVDKFEILELADPFAVEFCGLNCCGGDLCCCWTC